MQNKMFVEVSPCSCKLSFFQVQDRVERLRHLLVIHQLSANFKRFMQIKIEIFVAKNNVAYNLNPYLGDFGNVRERHFWTQNPELLFRF